ncbi:hypothetical protein H5410_052132 [Solanum commersonii]|uniref:Uncharacterized protein n=1 Tax=Solanum commersonii TaxID=4109 RepID=A0A9J5X000_SOLCO|nr:hypothetical protein H5410_052132 [Solanum commersonii]
MTHKQTAESFGELNPARQMTPRAYFSIQLLKSTLRASKENSKHAYTRFTRDPYFPSPQNTQTSSGPAKIWPFNYDHPSECRYPFLHLAILSIKHKYGPFRCYPTNTTTIKQHPLKCQSK